MLFFTADLHLGETCLNIMGRPFASTKIHDAAIIEMINTRVGAGDTLYVLGDVAHIDSPESLALLDGVKCRRRIVVRGNHDAKHTDAELGRYFDDVIDEGVNMPLRSLHVRPELNLNHYPSRCVENPAVFNLVGHIHSAWRFQLNMMNVGVDANHFAPLSELEIQFWYEAICNHYDDDVWAAYARSNASLVGKRGKAGTYLTAKEKTST